MNVTLLALHEALCAVLLYSCFCRAVKTNAETALPVLLTFYLMSLSTMVATTAPFLLDWSPDVVSLLLLASLTLVQTVTARYWGRSPPEAFQTNVRSS